MLTATEREVAELAAEGLTNREVADRLFVSVKAVAGHLTSVYAKLGGLGRTIPLYEVTLADRKRVLGPITPTPARRGDNRPGSFQASGDLGKAIPFDAVRRSRGC